MAQERKAPPDPKEAGLTSALRRFLRKVQRGEVEECWFEERLFGLVGFFLTWGWLPFSFFLFMFKFWTMFFLMKHVVMSLLGTHKLVIHLWKQNGHVTVQSTSLSFRT